MANRGATLMLEAREVIVEGLKSRVLPMVLIAEAFEVAEFGERRDLIVGAKRHVHRRQFVLIAYVHERAAERADHLSAIDARRGEKSPTRMRRERHAHQQLRVVAKVGALRRLGPSVVEDELAHAVGFEIERARRDDFLRAVANDE